MPRISRTVIFGAWTDNTGFAMSALALRDLIIESGLVQTSDTGQLDPATATKPGTTNTDAGYFMFRFDDPLQAVAPVFVRVGLGVGAGNTSPRVSVQVGRSTDGANNLTGVTSQLHVWTLANTTVVSGTVLPSFATHSSGFFAVCYAMGMFPQTTSACPVIVIQRSCDNTGSPTAEAVSVFTGSGVRLGVGMLSTLYFLPNPGAEAHVGNSWGFIPGNAGSATYVGLSPQAFNTFVRLPKCRPLVGTCGFRRGETSVGQTFPLQMVGVVPKTYLSLGPYAGRALITSDTSGDGDLAILWEL